MGIRLLPAIVALVLAIAPVVRAMCDVSCAPGTASPAGHCDQPVPHEPPPDEGCEHSHAEVDSTAAPAKQSVAPPAACVPCDCIAGILVPDAGFSRDGSQGSPPRAPARLIVPLRI